MERDTDELYPDILTKTLLRNNIHIFLVPPDHKALPLDLMETEQYWREVDDWTEWLAAQDCTGTPQNVKPR